MSPDSSSEEEVETEVELETLDISNDEYYRQVKVNQPRQPYHDSNSLNLPRYGNPAIRHSLFAYDLWRPFYPTWMDTKFHRPKLRHYRTGPQSKFQRHNPRNKGLPVKNLARTIFRYQKRLRNRVISAINRGASREEIVEKYLLIMKDLTAKRGELFLFEYCEEFPPVLSRIGMASTVRTLIAKKQNAQKANANLTQNTNPADPKAPKIGTVEYFSCLDKSRHVYFNKFKDGAQFQVIENNLYRAPIFRHDMPNCDFLIIRTRRSFYIREVPTIFTVGQTMPLQVVPRPSENNIMKFRIDLSNLYLHKMFQPNDSGDHILNFDEFSRLFSDYSAKTMQNRLSKRGAKKGPPGRPQLYTRGTSDYGTKTLRELRQLYTPEQYCLNTAMLVGRERLKELNYTDTMILPPASNNLEMETEVLAAPWNTTAAISDAQKNKVFLNFKDHLIDPTGFQKEGFSCVAWPKSETEVAQRLEMANAADQNKTNRDVSVSRSGSILKQVPDKNPLADKIRREKLHRLAAYETEANRITQIQSQVLASKEVLSSDDEMEDDGDENYLDASFDEQLCDLDKMVIGGQSTTEIDFQKEEEERVQLLKDLNIDNHTNSGNELNTSQLKSTNQKRYNLKDFENKELKITRTYRSDAGDSYERVEVVRDPKIIALYVKQKGNSANSSQDISRCVVSAEDVGNTATNVSTNNHVVNSSRMISPASNSNDSFTLNNSRKTLGPTELCRTEGIRITISKKVLNTREMRKQRRDSIKCR